MVQVEFIRNVSTNGYKLLKLATTTDAVYSYESRRTLLSMQGGTVEISDSYLERISSSRGIVSETSSPAEVSTTIHDLLVDSLLPLSESNDAEISRRAAVFLSAFERTAAWCTITPNSKGLPFGVNTREQTECAEGVSVSPATVYLRQRFPNLRFEWKPELTGRELKALCNSGNPFTIRTAWSAYLCAGYGAVNADPLVASGSSLDTIILTEGRPLISQRQSFVERIIAPEHLVPKKLPRFSPDEKAHSVIGAKISKLVRESHGALASLLALSALLASVNPLLTAVLPAGWAATAIIQIAVSAVGSLCAMLGMGVMALSKITAVLDGAGALGGLENTEDAKVSEAEILAGPVEVDSNIGGELWQPILGWIGLSRFLGKLEKNRSIAI